MAKPSTSSSAMINTRLDFKTLLESHAYISYLKATKQVPKIKPFLWNGTCSELNHLRFDVSWENARLEFQDPNWTFPRKDVRDSSRKICETWEYNNSLSNFEVTNQHKDKTKAVFSLTLLEGNTFGLNLNTSLKLPDEAMNVFGEFIDLDFNEPSFETHHDQEWKISVKVPVLVSQTTKLVTVIHEKTFKGTFSSQAKIGGKVSVQIFTKKKNVLLHTVTDDVIDVCRKMSQEISQFSNSKESEIPEKSIISRLSTFKPCLTPPERRRVFVWEISGKCRFTVGTHGSIKVESA